ncbi:hypothetical protein H4R34_000922 [Dimargaris verticillata]|uniref:UDENN domain-containing protein n=1 Tax=Dimargaris verticillata TaxID=2761393 RepID=A0A9W8BCD4_9FUNG|nr:hypothetical protein H4R34_000922 [Dimargaris verticillata]
MQRSVSQQRSPSGGQLSPRSRTISHEMLHMLHQRRVASPIGADLGPAQQWLLAFCTVNFDLDYGPTIDTVYPPRDFSPDEAKVIAFSAFPDSAIGNLGDTVYTFRVRLNPQPSSPTPCHGAPCSSSESPNASHRSGIAPGDRQRAHSTNTQAATPHQTQLMQSLDRLQQRQLRTPSPDDKMPSTVVNTADASFYYGYVFFRQKKDPGVRRGCFQKSLVLLSPLPYHGLFTKIVSLLGPPYFELGPSVLEAACQVIAHDWPSPFTGEQQSPTSLLDEKPVHASPTSNGHHTSRALQYPAGAGKLVQLPFLGTLFQVELPTHTGHQLLETCAFDMCRLDPSHQILATVPIDALITTFQAHLGDLWKCWEIMMLAEPLVVMASSPDVCSQAVLALVDLIQPITYCGDVRPYFTIQDADFKSYVAKNRVPSNVVLGVSNPFFEQALDHWPHVIRLPKRPIAGMTASTASTTGTSGQRTSSSNPSRRQVLASLHSAGGWLASAEPKTGLQTKRKSVVVRDKALLEKVAKALEAGYSSSYILNNLLRRHFLDLTERFLVPLNRYFSTLIPKIINLSTAQRRPKLKPFSQDEFLKSLQEHGSQMPLKNNTFGGGVDAYITFYRQFLTCGNFATWLHYRTEQAQEELHKRYCQVLCSTNLQQWIPGRSEHEIIGLLLILRQEIASLGSRTNDSLHHLSRTQRGLQSARTVSMPNYALKKDTLLKLIQQAQFLLHSLAPELRDSLQPYDY